MLPLRKLSKSARKALANGVRTHKMITCIVILPQNLAPLHNSDIALSFFDNPGVAPCCCGVAA